MARQGTLLSPEKKELFLAALRSSPNVTSAASIADISRRSAYKYRDADAEFATAWDSALEEAVDHLETEAHRRAFEGCEEPVGWHQGVPGGTVKRYSDTLAIFLLKAHRPERFRDNLHLSGGIKTESEELKNLSPATLKEIEKLIDADEGESDGSSS